ASATSPAFTTRPHDMGATLPLRAEPERGCRGERAGALATSERASAPARPARAPRAPSVRHGRAGLEAAPDVVAVLAHPLREDPGLDEEGEGPAAEAEADEGLQRGGHHEQAEHHLGRPERV